MRAPLGLAQDELLAAQRLRVMPREPPRTLQRLAVARGGPQRVEDGAAPDHHRPLDEHDLHGALLLTAGDYSSRTALSTTIFLGHRRARAFSRLRLMAAVFLALLASPPSFPRAIAWRFFIGRESNTNRL